MLMLTEGFQSIRMALAALICFTVLTYFALKKALKINSARKNRIKAQKWIQEWKIESENRIRLVQREIYLLEEMDYLRKQQKYPEEDDDDSCYYYDGENLAVLYHNDVADKLQTLQEAYDHTIQELWLHRQARARLVGIIHDLGPEAKEYWDDCFSVPTQEPEGYGKLTCQTRGGCCERECNCCFKPRQTTAGKTTLCWNLFSQSYDNYAHCTEECACCRRYWGFKQVIRNDDGSLSCIK